MARTWLNVRRILAVNPARECREIMPRNWLPPPGIRRFRNLWQASWPHRSESALIRRSCPMPAATCCGVGASGRAPVAHGVGAFVLQLAGQPPGLQCSRRDGARSLAHVGTGGDNRHCYASPDDWDSWVRPVGLPVSMRHAHMFRNAGRSENNYPGFVATAGPAHRSGR